MKKFLSLLLAVMLCCAVFVSCGKAEQEPEASPEPSVEAEASPSPTPEPRTEVGIPEELKFCHEPLYYGMTIEEIREIFGQEDETDEKDCYASGGVIGTRNYYIYNSECLGRTVKLSFRFFTYEGLVMNKSYGLDAVTISWRDIPEEEQESFMNQKLRAIIENLYGSPDSEKQEITDKFMLTWEAQVEKNDKIIIHAAVEELFSDIHYPEIEFRYYASEHWNAIGLEDEEEMYRESGKQGLTLDNLNCLKEGMTYGQAEVFLGKNSEVLERYMSEGSTYLTVAWEDDGGAYIELKLCDDKILSIYSRGIN